MLDKREFDLVTIQDIRALQNNSETHVKIAKNSDAKPTNKHGLADQHPHQQQHHSIKLTEEVFVQKRIDEMHERWELALYQGQDMYTLRTNLREEYEKSQNVAQGAEQAPQTHSHAFKDDNRSTTCTP